MSNQIPEPKIIPIAVLKDLGSKQGRKLYHIATLDGKDKDGNYRNYVLNTTFSLKEKWVYNLNIKSIIDDVATGNDDVEPVEINPLDQKQVDKMMVTNYMTEGEAMISESVEEEQEEVMVEEKEVQVQPEPTKPQKKIEGEKKIPTISSNQVMEVDPEAKLELSYENVKNILVTNDKVPDEDIYMFLQLCIHQGLNPFVGDAFLIPYENRKTGDVTTSIVVSKHAMVKKAEMQPDYRGFDAGIIVYNKDDKKYIHRPGSFYANNEVLFGGWCRVYRDGMNDYYVDVAFAEYNQGNSMWQKKPGTMIRKVAINQALREAFPHALQGMYDASEIEVKTSNEDLY